MIWPSDQILYVVPGKHVVLCCQNSHKERYALYSFIHILRRTSSPIAHLFPRYIWFLPDAPAAAIKCNNTTVLSQKSITPWKFWRGEMRAEQDLADWQTRPFCWLDLSFVFWACKTSGTNFVIIIIISNGWASMGAVLLMLSVCYLLSDIHSFIYCQPRPICSSNQKNFLARLVPVGFNIKSTPHPWAMM